MRIDRRRVLSALATTTATGLAGCLAGDSAPSEHGSTTSTETPGTSTASAHSRKLVIVSEADDSVSFDQRLVRNSDGSTAYRETQAYDPGERLVIVAPFDRESTYGFEMRTPADELVFERDLYPYVVRFEVTIRSATTAEQTGITEV